MKRKCNPGEPFRYRVLKPEDFKCPNFQECGFIAKKNTFNGSGGMLRGLKMHLEKCAISTKWEREYFKHHNGWPNLKD